MYHRRIHDVTFHAGVIAIAQVKTGLGDAEGLSELSAASSMGPSSDLSVASLGSKDEKLVRVAKQLQALNVALETTNPMKPHENPLPKGDVGKADRSHVSVIPTPQQKPMSKLPTGEKVSDIVRLLKSKPTAADSNSGDPEQTSRDVWKTHESEQENKYVLPSYVSWIIYLYIGIMQVLIDPPAKEKHSLWLCHVFSVWGTKSYIQHIWGTKSCLASVHL